MNVVIDCNIFISAILSQSGMAAQVLRYALTEQFTPQFGQKLFSEYESVLSRQHIIQQSKLTAKEIDTLFNALISVSQWNDIYYLFRPNLSDEADNHLIELAVASSSHYIVTNNSKDFIRPNLHFDIEIVTANTFISKEFSS